MVTALYSALAARIATLEANLLPQVPSTQVNLSQRDIDLTSSFLLLTVAELEHFIEEHCKAVVSRAETRWKSKNQVTVATRAMVLAKHVRTDGFKESKSSIFCGVFGVKVEAKIRSKLRKELESSIDASYSSYRDKVENNNGTHGLRKLFYPLGLYENRLDTVLLSNLDDIANKRGRVAHKSVAKAANVIPHPSAVLQEVQTVLRSLKTLDHQLQKLS